MSCLALLYILDHLPAPTLNMDSPPATSIRDGRPFNIDRTPARKGYATTAL